MTAAQVLRLRIRHFTAGALIGSKDFVNEAFGEFRDLFGPKRKNGARKIPILGATLGDLASARNLQFYAIS